MSSPARERARTPPAGERRAWRSVAVPAEHGGWSLTLEPVLLGLLVAWSPAGLSLGTAALLAFITWTPLKVVLVDRWRDRSLPRTRLAARIAAVELVVLAVLAGLAVIFAARPVWPPLLAAAPLVVVELWFDMRSRSRRLIPELAGAVGMGSVAAAIALADGGTTRLALGLWCVLAARSAAAIPYVRTQLQRAHGRDAAVWQSDVAQLLALVAGGVGWALDAVPFAAVVALGVVAVVNTVFVRLSPKRAVVLGIQQMLLGLSVVIVTAVAVLAA
ncbi:MAG: YwiC-like family protein [Acidimicrobiales bacterium]|nr:YwiC-like family protein [Acidimicrobiales bacterium]